MDLSCRSVTYPKSFSSETAWLHVQLVTARAFCCLCVLVKNWARWPPAWPGEDVVRLALLTVPTGESPPQEGYSTASFLLLLWVTTSVQLTRQFLGVQDGVKWLRHRVRPVFGLFLLE